MVVKGVLFDLDGVICDTAHYHYLAWKKLANHLGGDIDEGFNESLKGISREESLKLILEKLNQELDEEEFAKMTKMKNIWYLEMLEQLSPADILPGINEFIEELKQKGVKIAIASASQNAPFILEKIKLDHLIDTIADPRQVKNNKPAPDIFLLAAKQINLKPEECIGVEDSQAGINALNAGSIKSIAIGSNLTGATMNLPTTAKLTTSLWEKNAS